MTLPVVCIDTATGSVNRWVRGEDGALVCSHEAEYPDWPRVLGGETAIDLQAIEKFRLTSEV